jgi:hypothetical protein
MVILSMIAYSGAGIPACASSISGLGAYFPSGLSGSVMEKPNHLFMGSKGTIEATCSDVFRGPGQTGVDDAALLGRVLIVGAGEFGAIHHQF